MGLKLFVLDDNGVLTQLDAIIPHLNLVRSTDIKVAIHKYLQDCSRYKSPKNYKIEIKFLTMFREYLLAQNITTMSQVTYDHIFLFQRLLSRSLLPISVNRRFATILHFFRMCVRWEMIYKNPALEIKKLKPTPNPHKNWTDAEFKKFLSSTSGIYKIFFEFIWLTGCRPIEALNLKWSDIELDVIKFNCGKNAKNVREFPKTSFVSKCLRKIKRRGDYVFRSADRKFNPDSLYQYSKKRLKRLKLGHLTMYGIRHTFARRMRNLKLDLEEIQELMGHSDIKTTMGYIHDDKKSLMRRFEETKQ